MDYLSGTPDLIIHYIFSLLGPPEVGRISGVSRLFHSAGQAYFVSLLASYHHSSNSPISDFGNMYTQRVLLINSWGSESASKNFLQYNLVKSIKFGAEFTSILRYDGTLYTSMLGDGLKLVEVGVKEIDCCMHGMIVWQYTQGISWWKLVAGNLVKTNWDPTDVSVIAASVYGIVGRKDGKVIAFESEYQREVNFLPTNSSGIRDIKASPKMLLILTEDFNVYSCGMITFDAAMMNFRNVRFISIGNSHSLVLTQAESVQVSQWTTADLITFMGENGFGDCCKMIENHDIDGTDMQDMSDKYFLETLGIREPDRRNKLKYLLKQANSQAFAKKYDIYGWGRNKSMQLGPDGFMHAAPVKIMLPELVENERIAAINCDKDYSYLVTSNGRVLTLGGKSMAKMVKLDKKGVKWEDVNTKLVEKGKIVSIESTNNMIGVIFRSEVKARGKIKMRMAEDILRMIANGKIPIEAYEIGHLDRFLGILETSLKEFNKLDIPKHRIQFFKRNGKIVWDRRDRTDCF